MDQLGRHVLGPAHRQALVVGRRAGAVGVPVDLDPGVLDAAAVLRRLADDLPRAAGEVGAVPVEEHQIGAGRRGCRGRHRHRGRRGRRGRHVERVAKADHDRVVEVVRDLHPRRRRGGSRRDQLGVELAVVGDVVEPVVGGERQPRHQVVQRHRHADDRLCGERVVAVVEVDRAVTGPGVERHVHAAHLVLHVADAEADIRVDPVQAERRQAEVAKREVVERVDHRAILLLVAARTQGRRCGAHGAEVVGAVVALELDAKAVAEPIPDAGQPAVADVELRVAAATERLVRQAAGGEALDRLVLQDVPEPAGADVEARHRLRHGGGGTGCDGGREQGVLRAHGGLLDSERCRCNNV